MTTPSSLEEVGEEEGVGGGGGMFRGEVGCVRKWVCDRRRDQYANWRQVSLGVIIPVHRRRRKRRRVTIRYGLAKRWERLGSVSCWS